MVKFYFFLLAHVLLEVAGYHLVAAGIGVEAVGEERLYQFAALIDEAGERSMY